MAPLDMKMGRRPAVKTSSYGPPSAAASDPISLRSYARWSCRTLAASQGGGEAPEPSPVVAG